MKCFSDEVRAKLLDIGIAQDTIDDIDSAVEKLSGYRKDVLDFGNPREISERRRARNNLDLLRQGLLHRSIGLALGISLLADTGAAHGVALCARGQLEATAQLGYFCHRMTSLEGGSITFDDFHEGLALTLLAASHSFFKDAPKPLNVLTCIDKADGFLKRKHGLETSDGAGMLRDCYNWLSDYCHPNFLSSASSFVLEKDPHRMVYQHDKALLARNADLFTPVAISLDLFDLFWTHMTETDHVLAGD